MVLALHRYDKEWVIPGVGRITQPDLVTMLQTNSVFVEAFLVGLNHEMGRELLWRGYPTDQRGTCFRAFWTTNDELQQEVHAFSPVALGGHLDPRLAGRVVFLVRGELVRRYPGVVAHVAEADHLGAHAIPVFQRDPPAETLFRVPLPPNLLLVGFDITAATAKADPNLWFTLSENPTEPRFGFDESRDMPGPPPSRDDLIWADLGVVPGGFIPTAPRALVAGEPAWGVDAATTAHLLFQLPARAAFPATDMIIGGGG
jgi:hypothetical protein